MTLRHLWIAIGVGCTSGGVVAGGDASQPVDAPAEEVVAVPDADLAPIDALGVDIPDRRATTPDVDSQGDDLPLSEDVELDVTTDVGPTGPGITGTLRDETGLVLGAAMILGCTAKTCYFSHTDDAGRFAFAVTAPVDVALKTLEDGSVTPRRGAALVPVRVTGTAFVDVGSVYVPLLPAGAEVGPVLDDPQTLEVGDGLELTLSRGDLELLPTDTLGDVAARRVPLEHAPAYPELAGETVIAVYALHPFAARSDSPIGVRAAVAAPAGAVVHFRSVSEIDGHLSAPATGEADGAFVWTATGDGVLELTWLVVSVAE